VDAAAPGGVPQLWCIRILAAGYFPLPDIADLRSGGHELAEQIREIARRSA
jgi:hypothetical protein